MRILYIYTHTSAGGGETMLVRLIEGLDKQKYTPVVICSDENQRLIERLGVIGIKTYALSVKNLVMENKLKKAVFQLSNFIGLTKKTIKIIKQEKINLVQANLFYSALFGIIASKLCKKPFFWVGQTADDFQKYKGFVRFLTKHSDKTIVSCEDLGHMARDWGLDTKDFQVIYTGLDMKKYKTKEGVIEIDGKIIKRPIVAMIGRFDKQQKGHPYFIEAAVKIKDDINFLIVGGTYNEEEKKYKMGLEEIVKDLGLSSKIIFTGFYPDLIYLLSNIDIVVIPSLYEAPSAIALEAMAMKKPVIASDVGGLPEIVDDFYAGLLVRPKDSEAIASGITFLLKNPELMEDMGRRGYEKIVQGFTREIMVNKYSKLYDCRY